MPNEGKKYEWYGVRGEDPLVFVERDDAVAVITPDPLKLRGALRAQEWTDLLEGWSIPLAGLSAGRLLLRRSPDAPEDSLAKDDLRARIEDLDSIDVRTDTALQLAGSDEPILISPHAYVRFREGVTAAQAGAVLDGIRDDVVRFRPERVRGDPRLAFDLRTAATSAAEVFALADRLRRVERQVAEAYPHVGYRLETHGASDEDWTLRRTQQPPDPEGADDDWKILDAHASVVEAWSLTRGRRARYGVTPDSNPPQIFVNMRRTRVAVIDYGIDIDHPELSGKNKVWKSHNVLCGPEGDPRSRAPDASERHGTVMAGAAVGNGKLKASGTAPRAGLIPIRAKGECAGLEAALWTDRHRDAFYYAVEKKADVISCSWHASFLPTLVYDAISHAATNGRNGKGCPVLFSAGKTAHHATIDANPFASHPDVIAVGACRWDEKPLASSPQGSALWCVFPTPTTSHKIWLLDEVGTKGLEPSASPAGDYLFDADGGSSYACAATAGVVALMLTRNWHLTREEVKTILGATCDRIDPDGMDPYNSLGWGTKYGNGRVNALRAVMAARDN